jgi:exopolysaccharide production protein ExoY
MPRSEDSVLNCGSRTLDVAIPTRCGNPLPPWKRPMDIAVLLLSMPILLPLCAGISMLIKAASPGPILFTQTRVGLGGRPFRCFKFRTMHAGVTTGTHEAYLAELIRRGGVMRKLDDSGDGRLIFGGRLLRASGLDELPQLINVLQGEMSIVGPRPCTLNEFELYEERQKRRFQALPGLTGLWQVSGKNKTTFEQMIALDLQYVRDKSCWLDAVIMVKTVKVLLEQVFDLLHKRKNSEW